MIDNKLAIKIAKSFVGKKLTANDLEPQKGGIQFNDTGPKINDNGKYDILFNVVITGDDIEHQEDDLKVTKADISFAVELIDAEYNAKDGWSWSERDGGTYQVYAGETSPDIITYNGDKVLNDFENDNFWTGGLTEEEDTALSKTIVKMILEWTPRASLHKAFKEMVKQTSETPSDVE